MNHCHPDASHVCAFRMKYFAEVLARRGHRVVLLTETLKIDHPGSELSQLDTLIKNHDWANPFPILVKPMFESKLFSLRKQKLSFGFRQGIILKRYLFNNGMFNHWTQSAEKYFGVLESKIRPDIIWATFGNTDCWNIAQNISKAINVPWVADIKDNWDAFIPLGLSKLVASRFNSMAGMTAFSNAHRVLAKKVFNRDAKVIYSGFANNSVNEKIIKIDKKILITGSLYNSKFLKQILINGIISWIENQKRGSNRIEVHYAGNDVSFFKEASKGLLDYCNIAIDSFLPLDLLQKLQASAWVNAYIYNERSLFQHKTIELMAARRPIIAIPEEATEVLSISESIEANLCPCHSADIVARTLENLNNNYQSSGDVSKVLKYSWEEQSKKLEKFLELKKGVL